MTFISSVDIHNSACFDTDGASFRWQVGIVIDFRKQPGKSSGWVMGHVRANLNKVIEEIAAAGFVLIDDKPILRTNYFLEFYNVE